MEKRANKSTTKKKHSIMMRVDTELHQALKEEAKRLHLPVTTIIKLWIVERLQEKQVVEGKKHA
ncbi:MAG: CopG antitoxin of type toxin-antitoxin system [Candidatus Dadabacteria bacterium]|nr:CopG antitoxin of type toxin-antitoxin system [Candidatus Dadabacteria bacterium]